VLANDDDSASMMPNLEMSQATAAMLNATVISDSWGGADSDTADIMKMDKYFDLSPHKTGIFIASGDDGWNNAGAGQGMTGPDFPSTSEFVIAVGGTTLKKSTAAARGWTETVWSGGGSSCSPVVATPTWQQGIATTCSFRAAVDVAAVADPATGVNTICGGSAGAVGGTSAASPFVAAVFALYGHGQNKADFVYNNKTAWYDVTSGSNGSCGNIMCNAQAGWDGPTGLGTPNGKAIGAIPPTDGQTPPDMAMSPDMTMPPDLAEPAGNGGGDGNGGGGGNGTGGGTGTGGNGNNGGSGGNGGGSSGCSIGGDAAAGGLWLFLVFGAALLARTLGFRRD
jgi:subtilase family serine protease